MKKLTIALLSTLIGIASISVAHAADVEVAKLHMKITNEINGKAYALCLSDTCYPLVNGGKLIPIEASKINSVIMTDMSNMVLYTQKMPASCQVTVNKNQTLVVSGKLVSKGESVSLDNLHCTVN
jgi:hypothetical protein